MNFSFIAQVLVASLKSISAASVLVMVAVVALAGPGRAGVLAALAEAAAKRVGAGLIPNACGAAHTGVVAVGSASV